MTLVSLKQTALLSAKYTPNLVIAIDVDNTKLMHLQNLTLSIRISFHHAVSL